MPEATTGSGGHRTDRPAFTHYATNKIAGSLVFVAGISGRRPDGTIPGVHETATGTAYDAREQADHAFRNLASILESADLALGDIVDVTCYLVDMADYPALVETWNRYFPQDPPARTTVGVSQLPDPDLRVELKAVAHRATPGA